MADTSAELDLDHTGEDLNDLSFSGGHTFGQSRFYRPMKVELSVAETLDLVQTLEEAVYTLRSQVNRLAEEHEDEQYKERGRWVKRPERCSKLKAWGWKMVRYFTGVKTITFTVLLQLVNIIMLSVVDEVPILKGDKHEAIHWSSLVMIFLQLINLVVVMLVSVQLLKQLYFRKVSGVLLIQSFFATVMVFGGIYTATYRLDPKAWKFIQEENLNTDPILVVIVYCRFLFFSVSTATLCGSSDALPKEWHNCIIASIQMLLSFLYFTSIIGNAIAPIAVGASTKKGPVLQELQSFDIGTISNSTIRLRDRHISSSQQVLINNHDN